MKNLQEQIHRIKNLMNLKEGIESVNIENFPELVDIFTKNPDPYKDYGTDIVSIAYQFYGGGYDKSWSGQGVCVALVHDGKIIRDKVNGKGSYCCGYTLSVSFIAAKNRGLLESKSYQQVQKFSSDWYSAGGKNGKLCVAALKNLGIGYEVTLEDAQPGDFCQIWRSGGSGHSVIFLDHIKKNNEIIGIKYRSSQGSTGGVGDLSEKFSDSGGSVLKNYTYFGRMN